MIIECCCGWTAECEKPNEGVFRITCPDCLSAVALTISLSNGVEIVSPTDIKPPITVRYGADKRRAPTEFDRRMRDRKGQREYGLAFIATELKEGDDAD